MTTSASGSESEKVTVRATKERIEVAKEFAKGMATSAAAAHQARSLNREDSKSGVASKLKKTGVALIALPDPVTGAVGVPMLAAGFALEKLGNRELRIPEVTADLAKSLKELENLRRNLR